MNTNHFALVTLEIFEGPKQLSESMRKAWHILLNLKERQSMVLEKFTNNDGNISLSKLEGG